jgi:transposase
LWSTKTKLGREARMGEGVCPLRRMRVSFESRCRIVLVIEGGMSPQAAAAACGASRATGYRLWLRYREGGWAALADRSSTPVRQPRRLSAAAEEEILAWRAELNAGPAVIATVVQRPASTVGKVLRRAGCSRLPRPRRDPRVRYERERPGELLHVDTKKLGRFWEIGKRIREDGVNRSRKAGWQYRTSRSTTTHGSPTRRSCRASGRKTAPPSSAVLSPGTPNTASRSSG